MQVQKNSELFSHYSIIGNQFAALLFMLLIYCDYANTGSRFLMTAAASPIVFSTHSASALMFIPSSAYSKYSFFAHCPGFFSDSL